MAEEKVATVSESPATCYTIRNGWAWAHIFVRHGVARDRPAADERHWVHIAILSDFGEFGYCWSHIGSDWRAFLAGLDFDYAMRKMMGARLDVQLRPDDAATKAREIVLLYRSEGNLDRKEARELFDAIDDAAGSDDCRDFLRRWDEHSGGLMYRYDLWDAKWDQPNPQAVGFWAEIWPLFVAHIRPASEAAVAA